VKKILYALVIVLFLLSGFFNIKNISAKPINKFQLQENWLTHKVEEWGITVVYPQNWLLETNLNQNYGFRITSPEFSEDPTGLLTGSLITIYKFPPGSEFSQIIHNRFEGLIDRSLTIIEDNSKARIDGIDENYRRFTDLIIKNHDTIYAITGVNGIEYRIELVIIDEILSRIQYEVPTKNEIELFSTADLWEFPSLKWPFLSGPGNIIADQSAISHVGGDDLALDFCKGSYTCTYATPEDIVLAPTDITRIWEVQAAQGYHIFEITSDNFERLCMTLGHFQILLPGFNLNTRVSRGTEIGKIIDYTYVPDVTFSNTDHYHMGIYKVPINQGCGNIANRTPVPFITPYHIDGENFWTNDPAVGEDIFSYNAPPSDYCPIPMPVNGSPNPISQQESLDSLENFEITSSCLVDGDFIKPNGYFTSPANGATISSRNLSITANASDNTGGSGVKEVRFSAKWSGVWHDIGVDSSSPYSTEIDMCNSGIPNGDIELGLEVWDNAGNKYVYSSDHTNPHVIKNYDCSTTGLPSVNQWHAEAWMNKYLSGYVNHDEYWPAGVTNVAYPFIGFEKDWGSGAPYSGFPSDGFSFKIYSNLYFKGGIYNFRVCSDDGVVFEIDGVKVFDEWWDRGGCLQTSRALDNKFHTLEVRYYENTGSAYIKMYIWGEEYPRPDLDAPDGKITIPTSNSYSNQLSLPIWADAWDDKSGVEYVKFKVYHCYGGCQWRDLYTDYSLPYTTNLDTTNLNGQQIKLAIDVRDKTGKTRTTAGGEIPVTIDRTAPSLSFISPTANSLDEDKLVNVSVNSSDSGSGLANVKFFAGYVDNTSNYWHDIGTDSNAADGWGVNWNATSIPNGTKVDFYAVSTDKAGNTTNQGVSGITLGVKKNNIFLPLINKNTQSGISGTVTYKNVPLSNRIIDLYFYNGQTNWLTATTTDSNGNYSFTNVSPLKSGEFYIVEWYNNEEDDRYLYVWDCIFSDMDNAPYRCSFDVEDVTQISPAAGETISLPYTFSWKKHVIPTDTYEFVIVDLADSDPFWASGSVGTQNSYLLSALPSGFLTNTRYGWSVTVYNQNGFGFGYYYYYVYFNNTKNSLENPGVDGVGKFPASDLGFNRESLIERFKD